MNQFCHATCQRRGSIAVLAALFMVVIFGLLAFVTDLGYVTVSRTKQYAAVDAAALAAIEYMDEGEAASDTAIADMLLLNGFDTSDPEVALDAEYGTWDPDTHTFTAAEFDAADAVRVSVTSQNIEAFFGPVLNQNSYTTTTEAIATRQSVPPRDIVLVIDCSGSMSATMSNGQSRITNARNAAQALIAELRPDEDRVALAVYSWWDDDRNRYKETGHTETDLNFDHAPTVSRIDDLTSAFYTSYTNIGGGLRAGLDVFLTDPSPRPPPGPGELEEIQEMVLLTDGIVNRAEPYPTTEDEDGVLPPAPFPKGYKRRPAVTKWANTIKARGIKLYVVTLGDSAYDPLMVNAATPDEGSNSYYFHVADGGDDAEELLNVYKAIGKGNTGPKLVK